MFVLVEMLGDLFMATFKGPRTFVLIVEVFLFLFG